MSNDLDVNLGEMKQDIESLHEMVFKLERALIKPTQRIVKEKLNPDSIEIGTSKTGKIKIYGNAGDKEDFKERIKNMKELLKDATDEEGT